MRSPPMEHDATDKEVKRPLLARNEFSDSLNPRDASYAVDEVIAPCSPASNAALI